MITEMKFMERSLLFAKLASIAYNDDVAQVKKDVRKLGFTTVEFYNREGAQAYRFMNKTDLVIACRGTQPTEFNDIKADLNALPVIAETVSRVHKGFKAEVDELWPMVLEDIDRKANQGKKLWFCGHSLGAAMATIMASRCHLYEDIDPVQELYTYGSPRVGWKGYCQSLGVKHQRWVNNNSNLCGHTFVYSAHNLSSSFSIRVSPCFFLILGSFLILHDTTEHGFTLTCYFHTLLACHS